MEGSEVETREAERRKMEIKYKKNERDEKKESRRERQQEGGLVQLGKKHKKKPEREATKIGKEDMEGNEPGK